VSCAGFFVFVTDITERKRFELACARPRRSTPGIISISADAIISIDEDQRITIFNDGAERIFGYARAEVVGAPSSGCFPPTARPAPAARRGVPGGAGRRRVRWASGARPSSAFESRGGVPAEAAISKIEVGGNRLLTVALRDVTERRRTAMEQEILAEAGAVLASSLDYKQTLQAIAQLVVSRVADCAPSRSSREASRCR
jgi:PAS domain S-box-containing protein